MRRLTALVIIAIAVTTPTVQAQAPRSASQYAGLVLKKLDLSQPPSYPEEFFTPPPAPGEKGGRELLTDDVAAAILIMAMPGATTDNYCPPIHNILNLATLTNMYFDISQTPNPALVVRFKIT